MFVFLARVQSQTPLRIYDILQSSVGNETSLPIPYPSRRRRYLASRRTVPQS